jgi:hypothetical protein
MLLPVDRTDFLIHLPVKLLLTDEGLSAFSRGNIAMKKLRSILGNDREGLQSKNFNAQTVQKLVMNAYLEEIFSSRPEMLGSRNPIMDTTKLVAFGILYRKMNPSLARMLFESSIMQEYNRKNRFAQIKNLSQIDLQKMQALRKMKADEFDLLELEVRNEVVQKIIKNHEIEEEERLLRMRSLDKFVAFIDKRIWYLYYIVYHSPLKYEIIDLFSDLIENYLDRTKIATHLAAMVMELMQNAEKAHFEKLLIQKRIVRNEKDVDIFLKKIQNRNKIITMALQAKQFIDIAWRFDSNKSVGGKRYKVEIIISNHGLISNKIKRALDSKIQTDTKNLNLSDFYKESGEEKLGAGLGLLYLSYLESECKNANIQFKCYVYPELKKEKTTVKIEVIF